MRALVALLLLLPLASAATLDGRIVEDRSGTALPSAEVRVYRDGAHGLAAELETDGNGRFSADGLPAGEYRIEVSKPSHISSRLRTSLGEGSASNLQVRLIRCGIVSGHVLDANAQPIQGATVYVMSAGAGPLRPDRTPGRFATVDTTGRYRLFNLPPGQYILAASYGASTMQLGATGSAPTIAGLGSGVQFYPTSARPQPFTITSGEEFRNVDFSVLPSNLYSVSGKVETGSPLATTAGRFWLALAPTEQPGLAVAAATAEQDGSFRFSGIPPGTYDLFASGPSRSRSSTGAQLDDTAQFARTRVNVGSQDIDGLVLTPEKSRTVSFVLKAPATGCSAGGQLVLTSVEDWGANLEQRSPLPLNAPKSLARMAPARYRLSVMDLGETCYVPDGTVLDLSAPRDVSPVVIAAVPAGSIHGVVAGGKAANLSIVLADFTDRSQPLQVATPDAEMRFTFGSLRPGRYRVSAKWTNATEGRWMDDKSGGVEVDVAGGAPVQVKVPAPVQP